ncbi:MAG: questin oxidase family protein [Pseudomonadota bacterium]
MAARAQFDLETHARTFAPVYGEHDFSDHLPMAATALRALGANDDRVQDFAAVYRKRLKRKKAGKSTIDALLLSARMGDPTVYPAALNYFTQAIENEGRVQVLAEHLPELTGSIATAAFHGVIRVAFGLIADSDAEIAAGLAFWHSRAETVRFARSVGAANNDAETLLADVAQAFASQRGKLSLDQPTIAGQIAEVVANSKISPVLNRAAAADVSFDDIAATALRIYLASEDFTALHCVTGVHATRILAEHVVMDDAALRKALWSSLCAAYASISAPELIPLTPPPTGAPDWHVISSAAQGSNDEHDIKFAFSCTEESRQYGRDAHYRYAAALRLGLVKRA